MDQDPKPYPHMNSGILTTVPNVPLVREREQNGGDFEGGQIVNSKEDDCDDNGRVNKVDNTNSTSMVSKKNKGGDEEGAFNRDKWYLEVEVAKVIKEGNARGIFAKSRNKIGGDRLLLDTVDGNSCLDIEITKVIETGAALGFDFQGKEQEVAEIIARKEKEDEERLNEQNR
ncbi:hypothetical protein Q3G72_015128 [Acer saccharum]|nr:hypothetical protein Q3G72_015128 [Acer saccharum]